MSKRSITYTKPEEPNFLKKLKQQVGYQEGPTVDTKREQLGPAEDLSDAEDEKPTVVVLHEGHLTAEEAAQVEKEAAEAKADLTSRILFKAPDKKKKNPSKRSSGEEKEKSKKRSKQLLSFADDDDEEDC